MKTSANPLETFGSCACGRIQFHTIADPIQVSYCHCADCRKATGARVTVFVGFNSTTIKISGEQLDTHKSTPTVERLFCATCGSPIGYRDNRLPDDIYFYSGALENPSRFIPELHAWVSERLEWLEIVDHLPH